MSTETIQPVPMPVPVPVTPDVSDPVLFARLFEMLADVHGELGRDDLDTRARNRATMLMTEARRMIRGALSADVVTEFECMAPQLTSEPTIVELRLAYRGTLAWLAGLAWLSIPPAQSSAVEEQEQTTV